MDSDLLAGRPGGQPGLVARLRRCHLRALAAVAMTPTLALRYAAAGWPVFPCKPGAKVPATAHGVKDASTDESVITAWWRRNPTANVAIATGSPGPDVVDVDVKGDGTGPASFEQIRRLGLLRGCIGVVETPSGGWHCYFAGTEQGNGSIPRRGIDFRGRGGYVLAPPSIADGRPYVLAEHRDSNGITVDFAAIRANLAPPDLRASMHQPSRYAPDAELTDGRVDALVRHVAGQPEGNRNGSLYWASCRAVEAGGDDDVFRELARAAVSAGLGVGEAVRTIESARARAGAR